MKKTGGVNQHWRRVTLVQVAGGNKGRRYELAAGANVLGTEGDIRLHGEGVSPYHACVTVGEGITVNDMGSETGTLLNSRMLVGEEELFDGDELIIGHIPLRFSSRQKENAVGMVAAFVALAAAAVLLGGGLIISEFAQNYWSQVTRVVDDREMKEKLLTTWRNWSNYTLPDKDELARDGIVVSAAGADAEYRAGEVAFVERKSAPDMAYRSVLHMKRALALFALLPPGERPAVAGRAMNRIGEAQAVIRSECDALFVKYVDALRRRRNAECSQILKQILARTPEKHDPYHEWATQEQLRFK